MANGLWNKNRDPNDHGLIGNLLRPNRAPDDHGLIGNMFNNKRDPNDHGLIGNFIGGLFNRNRTTNQKDDFIPPTDGTGTSI
jgi:hypothetical protein